MSVEIWLADGGRPGQPTSEAARRHEDEGWDGYALGDSHNFAPDPYVCLGSAASATSTAKLGTWVTNPVTRHVAVTAASIGAVQSESGGRAFLSIAREDSPLAHVELSPTPVRAFEAYLKQLQSYLRGESVDHASAPSGSGAQTRSLDDSNVLSDAGRPTENRLQWIEAAGRKVPVDVAASGPKVIQLAALVVDRITFAVGSAQPNAPIIPFLCTWWAFATWD